jgi:hypothetical protein
MPIDGGDKADDGTALDAALIEALDDLADMDRAAGAEAVDYRWLGVGMKLGLERPDQARSLLAMIAAKENADVVPPDGDAGADSGGGRLGPIDAEGPVSIPVASTLLARAAALPTSAKVRSGSSCRIRPGATLTCWRAGSLRASRRELDSRSSSITSRARRPPSPRSMSSDRHRTARHC